MDMQTRFTIKKDDEDTEIVKISKGVLKARFSHYVLYDINYLMGHAEREMMLYLRLKEGGCDGI